MQSSFFTKIFSLQNIRTLTKFFHVQKVQVRFMILLFNLNFAYSTLKDRETYCVFLIFINLNLDIGHKTLS